MDETKVVNRYYTDFYKKDYVIPFYISYLVFLATTVFCIIWFFVTGTIFWTFAVLALISVISLNVFIRLQHRHSNCAKQEIVTYTGDQNDLITSGYKTTSFEGEFCVGIKECL